MRTQTGPGIYGFQKLSWFWSNSDIFLSFTLIGVRVLAGKIRTTSVLTASMLKALLYKKKPSLIGKRYREAKTRVQRLACILAMQRVINVMTSDSI